MEEMKTLRIYKRCGSMSALLGAIGRIVNDKEMYDVDKVRAIIHIIGSNKEETSCADES